MRRICVGFFALLFATSAAVATPTVPSPNAPPRTGWSDAEDVLINALIVRAEKLEQKTGIRFGSTWKPRVSIEWSLGRNIDAEYRPETQTTYFVVRTMYELNVKYKTPLRLIDPKVLAEDREWGELADHELGHALSDMVSRRVSTLPYFTRDVFDSLPREEQLGLNIVAEGIGMYFQRALHPRADALSELNFPASERELTERTYDMIVLDGGLWLVTDILSKHGERGLAWLVTHRLKADSTNMRAMAVAYRAQALKELAVRK